MILNIQDLPYRYVSKKIYEGFMRILIGISLNFQCGSGLIQNLKKWGNYPLFP